MKAFLLVREPVRTGKNHIPSKGLIGLYRYILATRIIPSQYMLTNGYRSDQGRLQIWTEHSLQLGGPDD